MFKPAPSIALACVCLLGLPSLATSGPIEVSTPAASAPLARVGGASTIGVPKGSTTSKGWAMAGRNAQRQGQAGSTSATAPNPRDPGKGAAVRLMEQVRRFDIPAGHAEVTVPQFAAQSGLSIRGNPFDLMSHSTASVFGTMTIKEGLRRLLRSSGLHRISGGDNGDIVIGTRMGEAFSPPGGHHPNQGLTIPDID